MTISTEKLKATNYIWIGKIPSDWKTLRLKFSSWLKGRIGWDGLKSSEFIDEGPYLITGTDFIDGKINWDTCAHITNERFEEDEALHIYEGDLLITKDGTVGKVAMVIDCPEQVSLNSGVMIIRNNSNHVYDQKFMYYVLLSPQFSEWFSYIKKPDSTISHLYQNQFKEFRFAFPALPEQQQIAAYLDDKCAKIDEAITKHRTLIEKLKEYRKAVITKAVTKGLDPNVEMKDSGINGITLIPAHWEKYYLKHLFIKGKDGIRVGPFGSALSGKMLSEGDYKVYNQANIIQRSFSISRHFVSEKTFAELSGYEVHAGDVIFTMMGTIGKCSIIPHGIQRGIMDSHLIKARLNNKVLPDYFMYAYDNDNTDIVYNQLLYLSNGSIMDGLNSAILKRVAMPIPPINEQEKLILYLDTKCAKIDEAIARHEGLITKLEEYKKSIIYNAVTGKIDCRKDAE